VSKGFSIPSVAESLTPNGLINTDLQPEIGINYEIGFKGNFWRKKLYSELNFYTTEVSNLLVARRVAEDQFIGINAGKSLHRGMEWLFQLKLIEQKAIQLQTFFSGTYTEIRFKEFLELDSDYSGNLLPAVPRTQWNFGLDLQTKIGLTTSISYGKVGQMALNDANTLFADSFDLLDAKVIYTFKILEPLTFQCQTGVQNILNEAFAASVLPNAVGFGSNAPRYFYPGNPINFYGGFSLVYQL
jgi:iron complex outermembrane receptor protein